MRFVTSLFSSQTSLLWAALTSAIVSAGVSYFFRKREVRHRLRTEYEYEQRKKLRELIGHYHGRLLHAANSLSHRFWNLYDHHEEGWLIVDSDYSPGAYYFHSFVHRFMNVCCLIRQFEREAVYVDARIAEKGDFLFLKYLDALRWCVTDVALFDGLPYDDYHQADHFFADNFRQYCDSCVDPEGNYAEFNAFVNRIQTDRSMDEVLQFFDSLSLTEERYRWDRLVAFHLILVGLINNFGYLEQQTSDARFHQIARQVRHPEILKNLQACFPKHGLARDKNARKIIAACSKVAALTQSG